MSSSAATLLRKIYRQILPQSIRSKIRFALVPARPTFAILDICGVCNAQCPFCPRSYMPEARAKGFMSDEIFSKCLEEIRANKIQRVSLYATAEPTLHPKFDEFIYRLKAAGLHVTVSTNAFTLQKHFESLSMVDHLQYSIEGWDKASYEKYRFPLKFDRVVENIRGFHDYLKGKERRPFVGCNLLLTKGVDLELFLGTWGEYVDEIAVHFLMGTTRYEAGKFITEKVAGIDHDYFEHEDKKEGSVCSYPFSTVTISFDGKIALCCEDFSAEMPLGNIGDGIEVVYSSPTLEKIRADFSHGRPDVCAGCGFFYAPLAGDISALQERIANLNHPFKHKLKLNL